MTANSNSKYFDNLRSIIHAPAIKQLIFLLGVAGGVTLGIFLYTYIQEPTYRPLDYQVNQQNMAAIVDTLEKAGIQYKINDQDGILYVAAKDVQQAKIKLSAAGVAKDDSISFSYLNEQSGIGNSQFLENARYVRALESDLSKTISGIEGISNARVHVAIPQNNVFADENQRPTASIFVHMAPGLSSDKEKVRAIMQIVASSVPGLDPKDVAITDQYGHYLSGGVDANSIYNAEQLNYQNNIQDYYEKRIESMLSPLLADNKVNVRVYANIDFTQNEQAQEKYDPEQKVIRSEQSVSEQESASGASGTPGALANSPPESESERGAQGGNSNASGSGKNESIKNYEIGKSVTYTKTNSGKINSLSVAVVVGNDMVLDPKTHKYVSKPLDADKINKITSLVKATIGFDEKRGDKVTVVNSAFVENQAPSELPPTHFWDQPWFWDVLKKIIGISLGFILLFLLYRRLSNFMKSGFVRNAAPQLDHNERAEIEQATQQMAHTNKQEKLGKLKDLASRDPDRVALIMKNWIGK